MLKYLVIALIVLLLIALLFFSLTPWVYHPHHRPPSVAQQTGRLLKNIYSNIMIEYSSSGKYPQNENEVVDKIITPNKKSAHFEWNPSTKYADFKEGINCTDAWQSPIRYVYVKDTQTGEEDCMVYSYGENGIDEKGGKDDISLTMYIYWSEQKKQFMIDREAVLSGDSTKEYRQTHPWPRDSKNPNEPIKDKPVDGK